MSKPKRVAQPGVRHRRDNGPAALEVKPVTPPPPETLGQLHLHTDKIIQGGPEAVIARSSRAKRIAEEHGDLYGDEFKSRWTFETAWLKELRATHRGRMRAEYAMRWRPTFLAVIALTHGVELACNAAHVAYNTVTAQREQDVEFDAQIIAAQDYCIELLHSVTMRTAIEGEVEPVFWQGIPVGHIKKFDNRLRVEMLRAHMPDKFKTPGSKVTVNNNQQNNVVVMDAEEITKLQAMRQESLRRLAAAKGRTLDV